MTETIESATDALSFDETEDVEAEALKMVSSKSVITCCKL